MQLGFSTQRKLLLAQYEKSGEPITCRTIRISRLVFFSLTWSTRRLAPLPALPTR